MCFLKALCASTAMCDLPPPLAGHTLDFHLGHTLDFSKKYFFIKGSVMNSECSETNV